MPENKCTSCETYQGLAKYWELESKKLTAQLIEQKKVVEQSVHMNEQAAKAIKALNNKIIRLENGNHRLLKGLTNAAQIRGAASAQLIGG